MRVKVGLDNLPPPPPNCTNGIKDGNETDTDCGGGFWANGLNIRSKAGICAVCTRGKVCERTEDCVHGLVCEDGKCSKEKDKADNFIGALIAMAGSFVGNVGTNVEKFVHVRENSKPKHLRQEAYICIPMWWVGFFMILFGSFADFFALSFGTQALVVASGGATTLVVNNFFAKYWHREVLPCFFSLHSNCAVSSFFFTALTPFCVCLAFCPPCPLY